MDCIFCQIASHKIPVTPLFENEEIIAFDDINPQARHHKIIIPKKHISTLNDLNPEDDLLAGRMIQAAVKVAKDLNIKDSGYRLVMNCNSDGGQTVFHIHLHLLGGRHMAWPPG